MEEWSIRVEGRRPDGAGGWFEAEELELVGEALEGYYPAAGGGETLEVRMTVEAANPEEALARVLDLYAEAVRSSLGEEVEVVGAEVTTVARLEETLLEQDDREVLLGVKEVAEFLGVSRTRVGTLRKEAFFPEPAQELAAGPVWRGIDVKGFERAWDRRSGPKSAGDLGQARRTLGASMDRIAEAVGVPKDVLLKLERGLIDPESLPKKLVERLAEALGRSAGQVRSMAGVRRSGSRSVLFKASGVPTKKTGEPESFEQALLSSSNLSDEQREDWFSEETGRDDGQKG